MTDIETLLGEEAAEPHYEENDRERKENPAGEPAANAGEENLQNPVRSPERRAEAFLTEWLRRVARG